MFRFYALLLALGAVSVAAYAQPGAGFGFEYRPGNAKVVVGTDTLRHAWAGGLNTPQFSNIDLNADGQADLFAFDRESRRVYTFLNVAALQKLNSNEDMNLRGTVNFGSDCA